MVGAKKSGAIAMPIEPPVMCTDIAKPLLAPADAVDRGRGRRMERGAAESAEHQQRAERDRAAAPGRRS